jgi:biotin carboxyl carrier protein
MATPTGSPTQAPTKPPPRQLAPQPPRQAGVDRFDDAIVVTRTRAWIGLAACLALVVGVVVWATTTTVETTVKAPGVALVNGTISNVVSPASGTIISLSVSADDPVRAKEVIGRIADSGPSNATAALVAPISGRILSLQASVGSTVHDGEAVANLTAEHGPLVIRMFVQPAEAQQASRGTSAILTLPSGGTVPGHVTHVGQLPLTEQEIAEAIGSQALASLVASGNGLIAVTVTPGGGQARQLDSGDVVSVSLIVGSQHPISYIF